MTQERVTEHRVVAALVQEQLSAVAKPQVRLAVLVDVRRAAVRPRLAEEVEDAALADVKEETDVLLAPRDKLVSKGVRKSKEGRVEVLSHMLLRAADPLWLSVGRDDLLLQTADGLSAEDVAAEQADHGV